MNRFFLSTALMFVTTCAYATDILPLKHGTFVRKSVECEKQNPSNSFTYDGHTVSSGDATCAFKDATSQDGNKYTTNSACQMPGRLGEEDFDSQVQYTITDDEHVSVIFQGGGEPDSDPDEMRWCETVK
jgi:hypothetical protein